MGRGSGFQAASIPATEAAGRRLPERRVMVIPDFVANSGASGWRWMVMLGLIERTEHAAYGYARRTLHDTVERLLMLSEREGIRPGDTAVRIATENTERLAEEYGTEQAKAPAAGSR